MSIHEDFKIWWHNEGSGMPPANGEETCDHVERISEIAWHNGAYKANDALIEENARLKAEVERLRKAGDAMKDAVETYFELMPMLVNEVRAKAMLKGRKAIKDWNAAKEGKPSV